MKHKYSWTCISNCGACCYLAPEERLEAIEALNASQRQIYLDMVGKDGWCTNYNSGSRKCNIYENRPEFCRVKNLTDIYNIEKDEFHSFAIGCCTDQIRSVYGGKSLVMKRYKTNLRQNIERA